MIRVAFIGAGSTVFAKNVIGDCLLAEPLEGACFALHDIDAERLEDSRKMVENMSRNLGGKAEVKAFAHRRQALAGADFVINAIQIAGPEIHIQTDFAIPKKYGLEQTIADTVGIGGLFRSLRTVPVVLEIASDMEEICPDAWLLNYTNPMAIVTGAVLRHTGVKTVGLCHSVQACVPRLLEPLGLDPQGVEQRIAGLNHQAWLLEIRRDGKDLYPEIKRRAAERETPHPDMVRYEIMRRFGHYVTESSEHSAEYYPYFIKRTYPEIVEKLNVPLDEWPRRYEKRLERWQAIRDTLINNSAIEHERTDEYASRIMEAMQTDVPYRIGGNVLNRGPIGNLPSNACVEVPCMVDRTGVNPCVVGDLPEPLAALNRTNINMQLVTIEAVVKRSRDLVYQAALLDPHTSAELSIDDTVALCDEMIEAHGSWIPPLS